MNGEVVAQQMVERLRAVIVSLVLRFVPLPREARPVVEQWARAIPLGRIYKLGPDGTLAPDVDPTIAIPLFLADVAVAGVGREHELSEEVVEREMKLAPAFPQEPAIRDLVRERVLLGQRCCRWGSLDRSPRSCRLPRDRPLPSGTVIGKRGRASISTFHISREPSTKPRFNHFDGLTLWARRSAISAFKPWQITIWASLSLPARISSRERSFFAAPRTCSSATWSVSGSGK
jgi:hypothetical protein